MPHAGHFKVKSAQVRNRMARNKARAKAKGVSDEQFADNWDKIFGKKDEKNKIKDIDFYHSNAVLIALLLPITLSFISLIVLSKIL